MNNGKHSGPNKSRNLQLKQDRIVWLRQTQRQIEVEMNRLSTQIRRQRLWRRSSLRQRAAQSGPMAGLHSEGEADIGQLWKRILLSFLFKKTEKLTKKKEGPEIKPNWGMK
jgi:hypothetical protein